MVANSFTEPFRDLYPFESHHLQIDSHQYHFLDEGQGDPLLMLHGNPTWSFYYRSLIKAFRHQNRCVVPDHMGCGLSDKPQTYPYTLKTHVDNLERLVDHLKLDKITLVLHDWGGAIGMGFAIRQPERVQRLVVFNTSAFLSQRIPWRIDICRNPWLGPLSILQFNCFSLSALWMASKVPGRITGKVRKGYLAPYQSPEDRIAQLRFVQDIPMTPNIQSYSLVQEIESKLNLFRDRPMMIAWGMKDFCFNETFLKRWMQLFPDAEVQEIAQAGHYVVEDACEEIIPNIISFLKRHPL